MNPYRNMSDGQDSKTPLCELKLQENEQSYCGEKEVKGELAFGGDTGVERTV